MKQCVCEECKYCRLVAVKRLETDHKNISHCQLFFLVLSTGKKIQAHSIVNAL
jgi:hypothetical protein